MSASVMRKQIGRLHADLTTLMPRPPRTIRLVAKPDNHASPKAHAAYAEALAWSADQASAVAGNGPNLVVMVGLKPMARSQTKAMPTSVD